MNRKNSITAARFAGHHGDREALDALIREGGAVRYLLERAYRAGQEQKDAGLPCTCSKCVPEHKRTMCLIRRVSGPGRDPKIFRAYDHLNRQSLHQMATTTGNAEFGIKACAAKAFGLVKSKDACTNEHYARIEIKAVGNNEYQATLT